MRNPERGKDRGRVFGAKNFATDMQCIPRTPAWPSRARSTCFAIWSTTAGWKSGCNAGAGAVFRRGPGRLYFRARDASFDWNFSKGYLGIWLQMVLVFGFGVMFSTFLSGPIAMLATLGSVGGPLPRLHRRLAAGKMPGGGPAESLIRMVTQENVIPKWSRITARTSEKTADWIIDSCLPSSLCLCPIWPIHLRELKSSYEFESLAYGGDDLLWQAFSGRWVSSCRCSWRDISS